MKKKETKQRAKEIEKKPYFKKKSLCSLSGLQTCIQSNKNNLLLLFFLIMKHIRKTKFFWKRKQKLNKQMNKRIQIEKNENRQNKNRKN